MRFEHLNNIARRIAEEGAGEFQRWEIKRADPDVRPGAVWIAVPPNKFPCPEGKSAIVSGVVDHPDAIVESLRDLLERVWEENSLAGCVPWTDADNPNE